MKIPRSFLALALLVALGACKSPEEKQASEAVDLSSVPCICGTPEAAIEGCAHPSCVKGEHNPDNPDCVCGPVTIGEEER